MPALGTRRRRSTASCSMPTSGIAAASRWRASAAPCSCSICRTPIALRDGDGLVLEDGAIVRVAGKPEPLVEIAAASPHELARLAWHIGNRHTDLQVVGDRLRIRRDHVLEDMLRGLGARSRRSRRRSIRSRAPINPIVMGTTMSRRQAPLEPRSALPADGVAVAGLSDRRVLLFERDRMGGRGRRHLGRRRRSGAGSP